MASVKQATLPLMGKGAKHLGVDLPEKEVRDKQSAGRSASAEESLQLPLLKKTNSLMGLVDALGSQSLSVNDGEGEAESGRASRSPPVDRDQATNATAPVPSVLGVHLEAGSCQTEAAQQAADELPDPVLDFSRSESALGAGHPGAHFAQPTNLDFEMGKCYPVMAGKLFIAAHESEDYTYRQIQNQRKIFFFSSELHECYMPFCADFGPVNIGVVYRFCDMLHEKFMDSRLQHRPLVYYTSTDPKFISNACYLLGAYLLIVQGYSPEKAAFWSQFNEETSPIIPFRDATFSKSVWDLRLKDCMEAMEKAMELGWLNFEKFDLDDYEQWDDPLNGDFHQVCPKFMAFKGPRDHPDDECTFTPEFYVEAFRAKGVSAVIRLNETDRYDENKFRKNGIKHFDLYFDDCTVPPKDIVKRFLKICEETPGIIAVHCAAGLGRTGTLIALWMMKHCQMTAAEAIGWLRIVRPGSVIGPQQKFLTRFDRFDWSMLEEEQNGSQQPSTHSSRSGRAGGGSEGDKMGPRLLKDLMSIQMAEQVRQGVLNRARGATAS